MQTIRLYWHLRTGATAPGDNPKGTWSDWTKADAEKTDVPAATFDLVVKDGFPAVVAVVDGNLVLRADMEAVMTANWTGLGRAGDPTDPANWVCKDAGGEVIAEDKMVVSASIPILAQSSP